MVDLTKLPSARWADKVTVFGESNPTVREAIRQRLMGPMPDLFGVAKRELRKTEFEIRAISHISALLNTVAVSMRLGPRNISIERIHILTENDYRSLVGDGSGGITLLGHSYVVRLDDRVTQLFLLTHELVHLASFLELQATTDAKQCLSTWRRSGFVRQERHGGNSFVGLNEAATEIVAGLIRDMLTRRAKLLDNSGNRMLLNGYIYAPQVRLLKELVEKIAQHEECDEADLLMSVLFGYLSGDMGFVRRANRAVPGAAGVLRSMGDTPEAACVAAYALGMEQLYRDLCDSFRERYKIE